MPSLPIAMMSRKASAAGTPAGWRKFPVASNVDTPVVQGADHEVVAEQIGQSTWRNGPVRENQQLALLAAVDTMARELVDASSVYSRWYEKKPVKYGNVNVKDM